ncbi:MULTISPECIES: hypothetical protein [Rhizobium]|uniref:Uncharacterized protein n=1 Tax=Rhizobium tropici TaxID=398 RepID=A0ABR6R4H9_RHITR|nr:MULTISPECIES: hypothetical protein [Rhizobium]MBB4243740.1 hypothetical protein [Rhizobium tropici]MBB6494080.1 hypothetical protein [Rhizobium tropici]
MIWDSWPWKQALLADANKLQGLILGDGASEVAYERSVFLAGFTIRKLLEAKKLTDKVAQSDVRCRKLALLDPSRIPDLMNWHRANEFYDYEKRKAGTVKLSFFTNQLIHSFIFIAAVKDDTDLLAEGFFVTTDYDRGKFLYQYDLNELVRVMRLVGNDEVLRSESERGENGDWIVHNFGAVDKEE